MDDVIRLEYQRWSGAHGYTADEFDKTVSDAAGVDVKPLLQKLIATTDEVDYTEMLDWFGLRFMTRRSGESVDAAGEAGRDRRAEGASRGVSGALEKRSSRGARRYGDFGSPAKYPGLARTSALLLLRRTSSLCQPSSRPTPVGV